MPTKLKLPKVVPPNRIEEGYQKQILRIIRFIEAQVREEVIPLLRPLAEEGASELPAGGRADSVRLDDRKTIDRVFLRIEEAADQRFPPSYVRSSASDAASKVNEHNIKKNETTFRKLIGIKPVFAERWLESRAEAFVSDNVDLITSVRREYLTAVKGHVTRAVDRGTLNRDFAKEIERNFGAELRKSTSKYRARARLIARDQIAKFNGQINQARQQSLGFKKYRWQTSGDERVRSSHEENNGKVFSWDNPPSTGHPGEDFQCLPGDSNINGLAGIEVAYRRWYTGKLTKLVTDTGKILRCTPNHPILTTNGFVPAHLLNEHHEIIELSNKGIDGSDTDTNGMKVYISQIFHSLAVFGFEKAAGLNTQFHGDGTNKKIDVVRTKCNLLLKRNPMSAESFSKFLLTNADMVVGWLKLSGLCNTILSQRSFRFSASRRMSVLDLILPRFIRHSRPFQFLRFRLTSWLMAMNFQILINDVSRNTKLFRNRIDAFPGQEGGNNRVSIKKNRSMRRHEFPAPSVYPSSAESLAQCIRIATELGSQRLNRNSLGYGVSHVIQIDTVEYAGHVYNLQTPTGYYVANSIVVGNCRCTAEPIIDPDYDGPLNIEGVFK